MNTYYIEDLTKWYESPKEVSADSVKEALKQIFPDRTFIRDITHTGDIIVKVPYMTRYGRAYKNYVYCDSDCVLWSVHTKK
jgi:hypothetical protein